MGCLALKNVVDCSVVRFVPTTGLDYQQIISCDANTAALGTVSPISNALQLTFHFN